MSDSKDETVIPENGFFIRYDGVWFQDGAEVKRQSLAALYARSLEMYKPGKYWVKEEWSDGKRSGERKYPVIVEDVPFLIVDFEKVAGGFNFTTNFGEHIACGPDNPLEIRRYEREGIDLPYVYVRGGLWARFNRNVFSALVAGHIHDEYHPVIESRGKIYSLVKN